MKSINPDLAEITLNWFMKAYEDLWMVQKVIEDPEAPTDLVAFHAQQAAEKCINGLLPYIK